MDTCLYFTDSSEINAIVILLLQDCRVQAGMMFLLVLSLTSSILQHPLLQ